MKTEAQEAQSALPLQWRVDDDADGKVYLYRRWDRVAVFDYMEEWYQRPDGTREHGWGWKSTVSARAHTRRYPTLVGAALNAVELIGESDLTPGEPCPHGNDWCVTGGALCADCYVDAK